VPDKIGFRYEKMIIRKVKGDPKLAVPMVMLYPANKLKITHVVVASLRTARPASLSTRETIAELLQRKRCLPRRFARHGENAPEGASAERRDCLFRFVANVRPVGSRRADGGPPRVMYAFRKLRYTSIAMWGDSFAEPNDPKTHFVRPYDVSNMPRQSEPMGGLLGMLGAWRAK